MRMPPAIMTPGFHAATLLQKITVFLKEFDEGVYLDYRNLISAPSIPD